MDHGSRDYPNSNKSSCCRYQFLLSCVSKIYRNLRIVKIQVIITALLNHTSPCMIINFIFISIISIIVILDFTLDQSRVRPCFRIVHVARSERVNSARIRRYGCVYLAERSTARDSHYTQLKIFILNFFFSNSHFFRPILRPKDESRFFSSPRYRYYEYTSVIFAVRHRHGSVCKCA